MNNYSASHDRGGQEIGGNGSGYVFVEVVAEPAPVSAAPIPAPARVRPLRRGFWVVAALFILTCFSTLTAGLCFNNPWADWSNPWAELFQSAWALNEPGLALADLGAALGRAMAYAVPVMVILMCHEAGHFLQARRYGVHATLPFFIPMPFSPIGTMGAVIAMDSHIANRKALFDIGVSGPLAGLVPTLIFCAVGLASSKVVPLPTTPHADALGTPFVFEYMARYCFPQIPAGHTLQLHPMAFAGWVGLLITALNLFPVGQLDGGHVLYGLLRRKSRPVARLIFYGAFATVLIGVIVFGNHRLMSWMLILFVLSFMGPEHPPTADDDVPLGLHRHIIGWLTLAFLPFGFTAMPIS